MSSKNHPADENQLPGQPVFHLVTVATEGKPLCGEPSPTALIGSYVEHIDDTASGAQWVRAVFDSNGKTVRACPICLARFPSVLVDGAQSDDSQPIPGSPVEPPSDNPPK